MVNTGLTFCFFIIFIQAQSFSPIGFESVKMWKMFSASLTLIDVLCVFANEESM